MTVAHIYTVAFQGIDASPVDVQVHISDSGSGQLNLVGLADKAVTEAKERVRVALSAIGLAMPYKRITVNLAPADLPKEGSHYDLPIALGLLAAMGVLPASEMERYVALGELSLDAQIIPVAGVLPAALAASAQGRGLICPASCGAEAAWAGDIDIIAAPSLIAIVNHMRGAQVLNRPTAKLAEDRAVIPDLKDVKGQETAKRALEIAAAGGHNMLMIGPPGSGKSMLAQRLPGILPPLDAREALEISMVQSLAGELAEGTISRRRPFRNPHHSASMAALVGGGLKVKPGEVSLAHLGVLFLDELPEFQRAVLDSLRQPIETGEAIVARANAHVRYPARFQLVAAMNPCRCGYLSDPARSCGKAPRCAQDYQAKISGPLMDRIDIHVDVPAVSAADLALPPPSEGSSEVALRVAAARDIQRQRFMEAGLRSNAEAEGRLLDEVATPEPQGLALLNQAAESMGLTARGYHRVLRVARTIADMEASETVRRPHIAEALSFRRLSQGF
ncbi:magnesium chelatase family protein [Rhizomicrobium palustre]|uniref:Magnesium chelatase family protein n=1 Tax=Rhizomicrobium palustre TaxID=189966 RepID=A0A846MXM5_9PROT|nr:YifB family Mg chelatase-like AAA ATPase [Rhizomicrobium palustre]NIK88146.1 magnesium chelatase family protein [Rhizomicrobium palustre]